MILRLLLTKLKSFFLVFINIFNRALCCFRKRRRSVCDGIQLTHVGVVPNNDKGDFQNWSDSWDENSINEPKTIQDHIDLYRKQKQTAKQQLENEQLQQQTEQLSFFDDMAPKITKQTKILINSDRKDKSRMVTNRLNFTGDESDIIPTSELGEWDENSGWEGESLDWMAQEAIREKKKLERERRAWEQQQKRQEKINKSLGSRISAT